MTRVLHLASGNLYGGVEVMLGALARFRAAAPGMEPHFAYCYEGRSSREVAATGAPVHVLREVRLRHPWTVLAARREVKRLIEALRIDVVVCHSAWAQVIFGRALRKSGLPYVLWLHAPADGRHWLLRLARRFPPDLAVCNSHFTAEAAPRTFPGVPVEVLYCPVDVAPPELSGGVRGSVRVELSTPEDALVVVHISRMEPLKGHLLLLQALAGLQDLPWVCWIAGAAQRPSDVEYFDEVVRTARELGLSDRLRFVGERTDVPRLLAAADIHCQPNTGPDAFGIAFVEALRAGLPCVTTALGGAPEVVDSTCGILTPPGDVAALTAALRKLLADPAFRATLGRAGPARARALCEPRRQIARLHEILEAVRAPARGPGGGDWKPLPIGGGR